MPLSIRRSIRTKIMVLVSVTMVGLLSFLFIISAGVYSSSFDALERTESFEWIGMLENSLHNEIHAIHAPTRDYATWDDTYSFMIDRNQTYVDVNLIPETFRNLEMSYIVLVSTNGEIAYGKTYNQTSQDLDPISPGMMLHLGVNGPIVDSCIMGNGTTGLIMVDGQAVLFAAKPILNSAAQGPSEGAFLMGRTIDASLLSRFEATIRLPMKIFVVGDPGLKAGMGNSTWNVLITDLRAIHPLNESTMGGYTLARDIYGEPGVVIEVAIGRDIHAQGIVSLYNLAILLAIASIGFGVITFLLLERTVVRRLSNLRKDVSSLGPDSLGELKVDSQGEDEIGGLAESINVMLGTIRTDQEKLIESEKRYRAIVEDQNELIARFDPEFRITFMNGTFLRTIGADWEMVTGKRLDQLMGPRVMEAIMGNIRKLGTTSPVSTFESEIKGPTGVIWVRISIRAIQDDAGKIIEYQSVATDITDRKRAEEALRQANNKLSIMSNITRHDINNQMMALNGFLELGRMRNKDKDLEHYFEKMSHAAANIHRQIAFTKGYQELGIQAPIWTSIGGRITDAFSMLHPPGIILEDKTDGLEILTDPLAEKVLYNLVDNSIRHGGHVKHIRISTQPVGDSMLIIYEDDGVGISAEQKAHLFEKGSGKNVGHGLFLVQEILAITGIAIAENGAAGKGVRFEILVRPGAWRRS